MHSKETVNRTTRERRAEPCCRETATAERLLRRFLGTAADFAPFLSARRNPPGSTAGLKAGLRHGARMGDSGVPVQAGPHHGAVDQRFGHQRPFCARAPLPAYQKWNVFSAKTAFSDTAYRPPATINAGTNKHNRKHQRSGISLTPRAGRSGATLESDLQLLP